MKILLVVLVLLAVLLIKCSYSPFIQPLNIKELYSTKFSSRFTSIPGLKKFDSIDAVYVVVMPKRKEYITTQMQKLGVSYIQFDAVNGNDISKEQVKILSNTYTPGSRMYNIPTRLYHTLSFTMCFIDAIQKGYSTIIVFEDDIVINVDLETLNNGLTEFVQSPFDFFYMGYCFLNCRQNYSSEYKYIKGLSEPDILCNHSTAIKVSALNTLLDSLYPMTLPTDESMIKYFKKTGTKVCVPKEGTYFDQVPRDKMPSLNESVVDLKMCR